MKIAWFSLWISRALLHNVRNYLLVVIASISGRHCTYKVLRPCLQNLAATSTCYKMDHCRRTIMNKHWEFASEKYGQFVFYLQTMVLLLINLTQCMILVQYYWYDNVCMKPSNTVEILKPRQMAPILQMTVSNAFSWMKTFKFQIKFDCNVFLMVSLTVSPHCFR